MRYSLYSLASPAPGYRTISVDIGGRVFSLHEGDERIHNYGHWLWKSSVALARLLPPLPLSGKTVLDLGAGLGLVGMVASAAGAKVAFCDTLSGQRIKTNLVANGLTGAVCERDWSFLSGRFDYGFGADILAHCRCPLGILERTCGRFAIADACDFPMPDFLRKSTVQEAGSVVNIWSNI